MGANRTKHKQNLVTQLITGGVAGDLTVTGIATGDILQSVSGVDLGELTSEFTISAADTINNTGGTSTAAVTVAVTYYDIDA